MGACCSRDHFECCFPPLVRASQISYSIMNLSIIAPTGKNVSGCGYCHSRAVGKKTSYTLGAWAYQLSCMDYQEMIDRGWRRSGHYCYKPNLPKSCCPQYTIRLDTTKFKPSKQHRQVINRFNKFIKGDWSIPSSGTTSPLSSDTAQISQTVNSIDDEVRPDEFIPQNSSNVQASLSRYAAREESRDRLLQRSGGSGDGQDKNEPVDAAEKKELTELGLDPLKSGKTKSAKKQEWVPRDKSKPKNQEFNLDSAIYLAENLSSEEKKYDFKTRLEPASCTDEKFDLYRKYQIAIHKDKPDEVNRDSFSRFLCESPLSPTYSSSSPPPSPAPDCLHPFPGYGSFHLLYYINDQLIAVSVIDILPSCVSAVYFFYDPSYDSLSLGKLSALYEISLVRGFLKDNRLGKVKIEEGADTDGDKKVLKYYYMGFYIHRCQKMVYKAQFKPSELLDPAKYVFTPLEDCTTLLDSTQFTTFVEPILSIPLSLSQSPTKSSSQSPTEPSEQKSEEDEIDDFEEEYISDSEDEDELDNTGSQGILEGKDGKLKLRLPKEDVSNELVDELKVYTKRGVTEFKSHPKSQSSHFKSSTLIPFIRALGEDVSKRVVVVLS